MTIKKFNEKFWILLIVWGSCSCDYVINKHAFPEGFMFGVATSAYQIEGAWNEEGKTPNIWDNFTHSNPTLTTDSSNGDIACDSYHKYETDVKLLKQLGVTHYRFSLSWTRILPKGFGNKVNKAGINYYKKLIKLLKENNIIPMVTLFHWDLPQRLQDKGGFLSSSFPKWFGNYARICFKQFGKDVKFWLTFNEGHYFCTFGYETGVWAPGIQQPGQGGYRCGYNLLLAHAEAWHIYDKEFRYRQQGLVSLAHAVQYVEPLSNSPQDVEAAERSMEFELGWWAETVYSGDYPKVMKDRVLYRSKLEGLNQSRLPEFTDAEKSSLKGTSDYFAVNSYFCYYGYMIPEPSVSLRPSIDNDIRIGLTLIKDKAAGFTSLLKRIQNRYGNPLIIITENGLGNDGGLNDIDRIDTLIDFMSRTRDAMDDGVNVIGYTLWSLLDNFEWLKGYTVKFGIHQVDFEDDDRTRTPKSSAKWYKQVINTRCLVEKCV